MPSQINLIPKADLNTKKGYFYLLSFYAKNILLVFNTVLFLFYGYRFALDRNISRDIATNQEIRLQIDSYSEPALRYKKYQDLTSFTQDVNSGEVNALFILDFLNNSTPTGISIKDVEISDGKVQILAKSGSPGEFTTFLSLVLQEPRFSSVILTSSQYNKESDSFSFTLKMDYSYGSN